MRVIFLDFDGVLIPVGTRPQVPKPAAMAHLNFIAMSTLASVVVSSNWKKVRPMDELRGLLREWGFAYDILGATPDDPGDNRGKEISSWIVAHPKPLESFVVLDDDPTDLSEFSSVLVQPDPRECLRWSDVVRAVGILKEETR